MLKISAEELLKGCLRGDSTAQERFYKHFATRMMGVCMRYVRTRAQAEDLLQEAFIKVFTRMGDFSHKGSVEGWVHRIVVTTAIDYYRSQANHRMEVDLEDAAELTSDENDHLAALSVQEILALINQLPDGYRMVLNLYAIEGYSHKEISEQLGIEEKTSCSQLSKARKRLLMLMRKQEYYFYESK